MKVKTMTVRYVPDRGISRINIGQNSERLINSCRSDKARSLQQAQYRTGAALLFLKSIKEKDVIHTENVFYDVRRGEIYYARLNPVEGSEQGNIRPVLILQNDVGNYFSPTTIQIRTIDKSRILGYVGRADDHIMKAVNIAISVSLGFYDRGL